MAIIHPWRRLGAWAALLLTVLAVSCAGGGGYYSPAGALQASNDGSLAMMQLFVTSSSSPDWGPDQLGGAPLLPGDTVTISPLMPDSYDVQAVFSDGSVDTVGGVLVYDQTTAFVSMINPGAGALAVTNTSNRALASVYLAQSAAGTWGPDQAGGPVGPGEVLTLTGLAPGTYDLRAVFSDGTSADVRGFTVAARTTTPLPVN
jgi:hypothetical protein